MRVLFRSLLCTASLLVATCGVAAGSKKQDRPNIIFILSDDLGYGDLGCYGQKMIKTPVIDKMAAEGLRFTDCYAGSAVCAPARTTLMTGLDTGHAPIRNNGNTVLGPEYRTVADILKSAGYHTALFGKWGLSSKTGTGAPEQHGFDESLAYLTHRQAHDYTPKQLWQNGKIIDITSGTYSPDLFTSTALEFIAKQKAGQPFFLYLSTTIPHANNELAKKIHNGMEIPSDAPYSGKDWPPVEKNKAAMITYMDREIGEVIAALKKQGLDDDTIIFFSSDNGPHKEGGVNPEFFKSGGGLKGIKRDLYEGGIRVPMIVRWPGKIKPGTSDKAWAFWDFLPTAAQLAGAKIPAGINGISVVPALLGNGDLKRPYLYWELIDKSGLSSYKGFQQAVRMGDWKAIKREDGVELYDLKTDAGETKNVASEHADLVKKAQQLFESARTELPEKETTGTATNSGQSSESAKSNPTADE